MGEEISQGITRRDLLRRGAVLGGAVVWATPVVQTLGMGRAFAQTASPVETRISFIAMNVQCGGTLRYVKWEEGEGWEGPDPGNGNAQCKLPSIGEPTDGGQLGISVMIKPDGCATVDFSGSGCTFVDGIVFGGGDCEAITDPSNICL